MERLKQDNMEELKESYDKYIEVYTKLNLYDKREEIISKLKYLIASLQLLHQDKKINDDLLMNREILDLNKDNVSEEDFLEGIFVYIHILEDTIAKVLE